MNKTRPFLHFNSENDYYYHLGMILILFILYGFYKNGILPFLNQDATIFQMLRPLLLPIMGFGVGIFVDYLIWWQSNEKIIWTSSPYYGTLITMTLPMKSNMIIVGILLFALLFLFRKLEKNKWNINGLIVTKCLFVLLFTFLAKVSFQNNTESTNTIVYSILDIFFGRNVGGVAITSIFLSLISYAYLWFYYYYKKSIPIYLLGTFVVVSLIFELILPTGNLLLFLLNPSLIFASIFFATEIKSSPYTKTGYQIYGIVSGLLAFVFIKFLHTIEGVYLALTIMSLLVPVIDNLAYSYEKKNKKFCRTPLLQKNSLKQLDLPKKKKCIKN